MLFTLAFFNSWTSGWVSSPRHWVALHMGNNLKCKQLSSVSVSIQWNLFSCLLTCCFLSFSLKLFSECIISKKKKKKCVAAFYLPRQQNFHKYITPHLWNKGRIPCLNKEETPVLLQIVLDRSGPGVLNIVILFSEQQYVTLILSLFMYKAILRLIIAMH